MLKLGATLFVVSGAFVLLALSSASAKSQQWSPPLPDE